MLKLKLAVPMVLFILLSLPVGASTFPVFKGLSLGKSIEENCQVLEREPREVTENQAAWGQIFVMLKIALLPPDSIYEEAKFMCYQQRNAIPSIILADKKKKTLLIFVGDGDIEFLYKLNEQPKKMSITELAKNFEKHYKLKFDEIQPEERNFKMFRQAEDNWVFYVGQYYESSVKFYWILTYRLPEGSEKPSANVQF